MSSSDEKAMEREFVKAVARASRILLKRLNEEPVLILDLNGESGVDCPDEVLSWLFKRRPQDGDTIS